MTFDKPAKCHHRTDCRLCLSKNVELVIPFKDTPLAEKYVYEVPEIPQPLFPVNLYLCNCCGHVQLLDVIDPEYLWSNYTYHSGQTQGIIDHFEVVSSKILSDYEFGTNKFVIDVGSNDGTFLNFFKREGFKVLGIDPATEIAAKATKNGIETIPTLMDLRQGTDIANTYGQAGLVTAFNVFAHADDMIGLVKGIHAILDKEGLFVFEVSYLLDIIQKMLIGTIFHEHLCNHSLSPLKLFLETHGLEIIDVEHVSIQGGSLIGYAQHIDGPRKIKPSVLKVIRAEESYNLHEMSTMEKFVSRMNEMKEQVATIVVSCKESGKSIMGYGAARSGPMLITQFSLNKEIEYIFDDHPQKKGMLTPGDYIKVLPTADIENKKPGAIFILAWIHADKIIRKHKQYLEKGGIFVTLTPEIKVITLENYSEYE